MNILLINDAFIAPYLARTLTDAGHTVTLKSQTTGVPCPVGGVSAGHALTEAVPEHTATPRAHTPPYDVLAHLAPTTVADAHAIIDIAANHAARIVLASSQDVYAPFAALHRRQQLPPSSLPLSEDSPLRTRRHLDGSEADALDVEDAFRTAASDRLPLTILRLPLTFGPGDPRHTFFPFIKRFDDARPAILLNPAFGNFRRTHAYVENVAHALALAITNPAAANRIYNVGEAPHLKNPTTAERLHELARAAKYRGQIVVVPRDQSLPSHLLHNLDFRHDLIANDTAIRKEIGYTEIIPTDEAFRRTIAWQRATPPSPADTNAADFDYAAEEPLLRNFGLLPKPKPI